MITDKKLLDLIDGNLDEQEEAQIKKLIEAEPDLRRRYETLLAVDATLVESVNTMPSSSFTENVMANLHKNFAYTNSFWKKNLFMVIAIVSVVLVAGIILLSSPALSNIFPSIEPQQFTISERTISIDPGKLNFINQDIFIKGFIYLNAVLVLFLLDRAVLKPYFRNRRQSYSL